MKKKHILLIENDEDELDFFSDALEESKLSFLCSTARSTEQAVKMLKNIVPDIIFLDMHISNISGMPFFKKIKSMVSEQKTTVIMYSNLPESNNDHGTDGNEPGYLHLPGNVQTMASILQNLLQTND